MFLPSRLNTCYAPDFEFYKNYQFTSISFQCVQLSCTDALLKADHGLNYCFRDVLLMNSFRSVDKWHYVKMHEFLHHHVHHFYSSQVLYRLLRRSDLHRFHHRWISFHLAHRRYHLKLSFYSDYYPCFISGDLMSRQPSGQYRGPICTGV